jgi:FdhE protein
LPAEVAGLETVLLQAMRPILTRAADAIVARVDLTGWVHGTCPVCGGEPDLAVITPAADRLLICSRCLARWRFDQIMCPFCRNAERSQITSFTSRDGRYRLSACDVCERYLKAYDARRASRPVMPRSIPSRPCRSTPRRCSAGTNRIAAVSVGFDGL